MALTSAVLLQPAYLSVQAFQCVSVVLLQEEQVILGTLQLVLQADRRHSGSRLAL